MFYSAKEITEKNKSKIYESLMEFVWEYEELGRTKRVNSEGVYLSSKMRTYLADLKEKNLVDSFDIIDSDIGIISVCYAYEGKMEHFIVNWEN